MNLEFFGAAGEVTGSCHVLRVGGRSVLLDCGLIQGGRSAEARNHDPFPFVVDSIDAVVLSHAHLDHSGRLPLLVRRGYRGPIFAHEATCELLAILLADAAKLELRDAEYLSRKFGRRIKPLFTVEQGAQVIRQLEPLKYGNRTQVANGVTIRYRDAGHILGSCTLEAWLTEQQVQRKLVFSGDLGQYDTPILRDPEPIDSADVVIMESTYGDRRHRNRESTIEEIGGIIAQAGADRGNILIPAFAVGRSQELLYLLGKHYKEWGLNRFRIYLDSPMAIETSEVYWNYAQLHDAEAVRLARKSGGMPLLPNLQLSRSTEESIAINRFKSGAIIIAGSGMCNGGRIVHHLKNHLEREPHHVVIVGYQARGSLGRRLVEGEDTVRIHGKDLRVRARIHTVGGLSAHGDQDDLACWYECMAGRPPVFLVHGEERARENFAEYLGRRNEATVGLPSPGDVLDLESMSLQVSGSPGEP